MLRLPFIALIFITSIAHASINDIASRYVALVLAVGEHDPVYVDAYYGPENIKKTVIKQGWSLDKIVKEAEVLVKDINGVAMDDEIESRLRRHYLKTQLSSLIFHANQLINKKQNPNFKRNFDYEAVSLYDTLPPKHDFAYFDKALNELDALLPGEGDIAQRTEVLLNQVTIPKDKLDQVFKRAMQECRARTLKAMTLANNESFSLEYVSGKAWSGYNWYQGNANSLIQINTDFPIRISRAIDLGCHEGYPGHHTYNALLEENLVVKKGWVELSVYPLFSPQSLIAEGTANYGIDMAFPRDEKTKFEKAVLFPMAGLDPKYADLYEQFLKVKAKLSYAGNEIARLYINGEITRAEAIRLQNKYALEGMNKAEQRISFVEKYGAYVINYNWGKDLVKRYVEENSQSEQQRWTVFTELLKSPRLPSSLNWH